MQRRDAYSQAVHIGGATPRETEMLAFGFCNARLSKASDPRSRIDALSKTHQLWSLMVRDLACEGNMMPETTKQDLIGIGFWAMGYSVAAACHPIPLQPLIDVNQNILEGLRLQSSAGPQGEAGQRVSSIAARV